MIRKLCGAAVVGALLGAIAPMGCGTSESSFALIPQRAHYGEFGYLPGDDDAVDTLLKKNKEIANELRQVHWELDSARNERIFQEMTR